MGVWASGAWASGAWAGTAWADPPEVAGSAWATGAWKSDAWLGTAWHRATNTGSAWREGAWAVGAWNGTAWAADYVTDNQFPVVPYALTGQDASLRKGYVLTAEGGSYALTGEEMLRDILLQCGENGSYALTGQDAGLRKGYRLVAGTGSYGLSGQAATFKHGLRLMADYGAYSLSGQAAGKRDGHGIAALTGSYALTGQDVTFKRGLRLVAEAGSYALLGQNALLDSGWPVVPYTLTGQDIELRKGWRLRAETGTYRLGGQLVDPITTATEESRNAGGWPILWSKRKSKEELRRDLDKIETFGPPVQKALKRAAKKVIEQVEDDEISPELVALIEKIARAEIERIQAKWKPAYGKTAAAIVAEKLSDDDEAAELAEIAQIFFSMN